MQFKKIQNKSQVFFQKILSKNIHQSYK